MRIVVDLDGTICPIKKPGESYSELLPHEHAVRKLQELKDAGHYIIIHTARNMATCESNLGKVMKNVGRVTLDWLDEHQVPYHEIFFGKPNADIYIDDRALRFQSWEAITEDLLTKMGKSR